MLKNSLLFFAGILAATLIGEGVVRLFFPEQYDYPRGLYIADKARGYWLTPGFCGNHRQINGDFSVDYCINQYGYRASSPLFPIADSQIAVLGDSFSFGVGVEDHETYAEVLSRSSQLATSNAAISGYDIPSAKEALSVLLAQGAKPTIMVLGIYLGNDLLPPDKTPAALALTAVDGATITKSALGQGRSASLERRLRHHFRLYGFIASRITQFIPASALHRMADYQPSVLGLLPADKSEIIARIERDLVEFSSAYKNAVPHGRLILLSIPTKFQVETPFQEEVCQDLQICPTDEQRLKTIVEIQSVARRLGLPLVDMHQVLTENAVGEENEFYFYHNDHWNPKAHRLAGQALSRLITQNRWNDPSR